MYFNSAGGFQHNSLALQVYSEWVKVWVFGHGSCLLCVGRGILPTWRADCCICSPGRFQSSYFYITGQDLACITPKPADICDYSVTAVLEQVCSNHVHVFTMAKTILNIRLRKLQMKNLCALL